MRIQELQTGQMISLTVKAGEKITGETGVMWVTFENQIEDTLLRGGQSRFATRSGKVVVQAMESGRFCVTCKAGSTPPLKALAIWLGLGHQSPMNTARQMRHHRTARLS